MSDLNETIPFDGEGSLEDNTVVREQEEGVVGERESDGNFKRSPKSKISGQIKAAEDSVENQTTHSSKTLRRAYCPRGLDRWSPASLLVHAPQ